MIYFKSLLTGFIAAVLAVIVWALISVLSYSYRS